MMANTSVTQPTPAPSGTKALPAVACAALILCIGMGISAKVSGRGVTRYWAAKSQKFNRTVANHLIAKLFRKMLPIRRRWNNANPAKHDPGGEVLPLHDVVFAQAVEKPRADLIRLVSRIKLPVPIIRRFHLQVEVLELLFPF